MDSFDSAGITGIVWRQVDPGREAEAETLMRELLALSRKTPGYLGSEIFPPVAGVQDAYVVLYRYSSSEHIRNWLNSPARAEALKQMQPLLTSPPFEFFLAHRRQTPGTASSVFSYRIRKDCLDEFHAWRIRIMEAIRTWDGFLGSESFDTLDTDHPEFVVVLRFDTRAHLDRWLHSPERAKLIGEVRPYIDSLELRRIGTGFEGWFDYSADRTPPASWRQGLVILSALYPVIMTLRHLAAPAFRVLPFPVAFLLLLMVDLSLLTFLIMPHYSRFMNFWLRPGPHCRWQNELKGWAIIVALIAATLAVSMKYEAFK